MTQEMEIKFKNVLSVRKSKIHPNGAIYGFKEFAGFQCIVVIMDNEKNEKDVAKNE